MAYRQRDQRPRYSRNSLVEPQSALYAPPDEPELDLRHFFRVFRRRRALMIKVLAVVLLIGVAFTLLQKPLYRADATVIVQSSKANPFSSLAGAAALLPDLGMLPGGSSQETVATLMSDDHFLDEVFAKLSPSARRDGYGRADEIPEWAVSIKPKRNTDVIRVSALSRDARTSTALADMLVKEYVRQDDERNRLAVESSRGYAQEKMAVLGRQLKQANSRMARFKSDNGLFAPEVQLTKAAEYVATLELERQAAMAGRTAVKKQMATITRELADQKATVVSSTVVQQNPRLADALKSLDELSRKRIELLQEYNPGAPEIKTLDDQISQSQAELKNLAQTIVGSQVESRNPLLDELSGKYYEALAAEAANQARVTAIDTELENKHRESLSLPEKERQLAELMQTVEILKRTYGAMTERYYTLLLSEKTGAQGIRVVSWAKPELEPVNRQFVRNGVLFLLLGIVASTLLALGAERFDMRVRDQRSAESISGYLASAVVPDVASGTPPVLEASHAPAALLESFRVLRNNIYLAGIESTLKTIAVTSATPKEGKSVTCVNLAKAMAMDGKRVVLVDCSMHNPSIGQMMKMPYESGLTNVLTRGDLAKAVARADLDGLSFITTGPLVLNFSELLHSENSRALFAELSERYDFVLLDCPPVACFSDIQAISSLADAFLLVVALDETDEETLAAAVSKLELLNSRVLGLVLRGGDSNPRQPEYANAAMTLPWASSDTPKDVKKVGR